MQALKKYLKLHHPPRTAKPIIGILQVLLGWLLISFTLVLNKLVPKTLTSSEVLFLQFFWMLVALLPYLLWRGISFLLTPHWKQITARGIAAVLAYYFFVDCGRRMSLVDNSLLFNTEALFVPVLLWLVYKQIIDRATWFGIIFGFMGVGLVYRPDEEILNIAALIGLGGGLFTGVVVLLTSVVIHLKESPLKVAIYHALIATVAFGLLSIFDWQIPATHDMVYPAISGLLFACAIYLFVRAFHHTESHIIGGLSYSLVVFSGALDWWIFNEAPECSSMIGFVMILTAGIIIIRQAHKHGRKRGYFV